jgi:hypothetical protein
VPVLRGQRVAAVMAFRGGVDGGDGAAVVRRGLERQCFKRISVTA